MSWQDSQSKRWEVAFVVAMDQQRGIGKNNQLPWHLPGDLKHFKAKTLGGVVLMGRKTYESMGRPLPGRANWVLTNNSQWQPIDEQHQAEVGVAHDLTTLLERGADEAEARGQNTLLVIGGANLFEQTLSICDRIELTRVETDAGCDTFFPAIPPEFKTSWSSDMQQDSKSGLRYTFQTLTRNV